MPNIFVTQQETSMSHRIDFFRCNVANLIEVANKKCSKLLCCTLIINCHSQYLAAVGHIDFSRCFLEAVR